jgi:hypothetical protein
MYLASHVSLRQGVTEVECHSSAIIIWIILMWILGGSQILTYLRINLGTLIYVM